MGSASVARHRPTSSARARAAVDDMLRVCRKLWSRSYVDGNGGNVSCRVEDDWVLCTPTLLSKADVTARDLVWIDSAGRKLSGRREATSETRLHLAIYHEVSEARAVVHCHPPHATAFALAGHAPPLGHIPELEVFVGPVGVAPYRTPGSEAFARIGAALARDHNTILLGNHGVVAWADTLAHAEWRIEILETYCQTLAAARQLGLRPRRLGAAQIRDLLALKARLGIRDPRQKTSRARPSRRR